MHKDKDLQGLFFQGSCVQNTKYNEMKLVDALVIVSSVSSTMIQMRPGKALSRIRRPTNRVMNTWYCANSWTSSGEV